MITILVATHDRPALLRRALLSIAAQTCREFSVVCVADRYGTDFQDDVLASLGRPVVCATRNGTPGPAESRNLALRLVETEYFMFLDDDDSLEPDHVAVLADHLARARPDLTYCDFNVVNEVRGEGGIEETSRETHPIGLVRQEDLFVKCQIPNSCLVYRSAKFQGKRFDPGLLLNEDWDFLLRCLPSDRFNYVARASVNIHKTPRPVGDRRGARNDDKLLENVLRVYANNPSPTAAIRQARKDFVAGAGVDLPLELF